MTAIKNEVFSNTVLRYLEHLNESDAWILDEAYKFEFANFVQRNVNFAKQTNEEILKILLKSQENKYDRIRGVQFIQKNAKNLSVILELKDIELFRGFSQKDFESIDWQNKSMSFTALSAWLSSLCPDKFYPVPMTGIDKTINVTVHE